MWEKQYEKATIIPITDDSGKIISCRFKLDITKEIDDQNALRGEDRKFFSSNKNGQVWERCFLISHIIGDNLFHLFLNRFLA